jgi:hypothetical protein
LRLYSTFDLGREREAAARSVAIPQGAAEGVVRQIRWALPSGIVAFIGTTRWLVGSV